MFPLSIIEYIREILHDKMKNVRDKISYNHTNQIIHASPEEYLIELHLKFMKLMDVNFYQVLEFFSIQTAKYKENKHSLYPLLIQNVYFI